MKLLPTLRIPPASGPPALCAQRRAFWRLPSWPAARPRRDRRVVPGLDKLREVEDRLGKGVRLPPRAELRAALREFLTHKRLRRQPVLDTEIAAACAAADHAREEGADARESADAREGTAAAPLGLAAGRSPRQWAQLMRALAPAVGAQHRPAYARLARLLHDDFEAQRQAEAASHPDMPPADLAYRAYLAVLAACGEGALVRTSLEEQLARGRARYNTTTFWGLALRGYARAGDDERIRRTLDRMEELGVPFSARTLHQIVIPYAEQRDMARVKRWYNGSLAGDHPPSVVTRLAVLEACIATRDLEFGREVSEVIPRDGLSKSQWDTVLRWSVLSGQSVDDIERHLHVMATKDTGEGTASVRPDTNTFNVMVAEAYQRGDAHVAERFIELSKGWGMRPNVRTRLTEVHHLLSIDDLAGADKAWTELQKYEMPEGEDVALINGMILKFCEHHLEEEVISNFLYELRERSGDVVPETLVALCLYHLKRQEYPETIDLLQAHVSRYRSDQRALVRDALTTYVLADATETADAWDAYCILHEAFDADIDRAGRLGFMGHFFARGATDYALHAFGHMRQTTLPPARRADAAAYAACLVGVAAGHRAGALDTVYNMLKLDAAVEPTPRLRDALLLAHLECGRPDSGLEVWDAAAYVAAGGPSRASVLTALRCCQFARRGATVATAIWAQLPRFRVPVDRGLAEALVSVRAAHGELAAAFAFVQSMRAELGMAPNAVTMAELVNSPNELEQAHEAIRWVKDNYAPLWAELEQIGYTKAGKFKAGWYSRDHPLPCLPEE